jgi:hypothetical protein
MLARDGTVQPHGHCLGAYAGRGGHLPCTVTSSMLNGDQKSACVDGGRYRVPSSPGDHAQMQPDTLSRFAFAAGADWRAIGKG